MKTKTKSEFKAVDYMRKVRSELSNLIQTDKKRFHDELKKTMEDFIAKRQKASHQKVWQQSGDKNKSSAAVH